MVGAAADPVVAVAEVAINGHLNGFIAVLPPGPTVFVASEILLGTDNRD